VSNKNRSAKYAPKERTDRMKIDLANDFKLIDYETIQESHSSDSREAIKPKK
jgi:hypothetical protein